MIIGGIAMLWGYTRSALQRKERYDDKQFRQFLRRYQWQCLLKGKTRATDQLNTQQTAQWHQSRNTYAATTAVSRDA